MENNKSQFKRTGVLHDGVECVEIQISHSGNAARYVSTIMFTVRDPEVTRGLWAHDEQKQIVKLSHFIDLLPVKPEWLTREQIDEYAARMGVK